MAAGLLCVWSGCASSQSRPASPESVIKAQETATPKTVTRPATEHAIFTPPVLAPTAETPQDYPISNFEHWITKITGHGKVVELEDGSVWDISPAYQAKTMTWLGAQKITVSNGLNPQYPYQLSNTTTKDTVEGRLASGAR